MKVGVSFFAWTAQFEARHLTLLPQLREHGLDGFEVAMFEPGALDTAAIRRAAEASGLDCSVCAILPPGINPISPDPADRRRAQQHFAACIEAAADMGARLIGGPLYAPIGYLPGHRPTVDERTWAIEAFQSVGNLLDAHDITLALEPVNRSETFFLRTAAEARSLCEAIAHPRIGVTIDTFHANIEEANIAAAVRSLGPWLKHIHASENDRGRLGSGHVDFPAIVKALREANYDGYLMIEGFGYAESERNGPGFLWARQEDTPEDVAFQGASYLRQLLA